MRTFIFTIFTIALLMLVAPDAMAQDEGLLSKAKSWFSSDEESKPEKSTIKEVVERRKSFGTINVGALYDPAHAELLKEHPEIKELLEHEQKYMQKLGKKVQEQIKEYQETKQEIIDAYRTRLAKENPELLAEAKKQCESDVIEVLLEEKGLLLPPAKEVMATRAPDSRVPLSSPAPQAQPPVAPALPVVEQAAPSQQ